MKLTNTVIVRVGRKAVAEGIAFNVYFWQETTDQYGQTLKTSSDPQPSGWFTVPASLVANGDFDIAAYVELQGKVLLATAQARDEGAR